jgi:hypothetical protein
MEHTKGKAESYVRTVRTENMVICSCHTFTHLGSCGEDEAEANAIFIADAFNTTNESGLTTSELYKQNQELLQVLTAFIDGKERDFEVLAKNARQAINNAKSK